MKKLIIKAVIINTLVIGLVVGWFILDYQEFLSTPLKLGEQGGSLFVKKGASFRSVTNDLKKRKIISSPKYLVWHAKLTGKANKLHVGEYIIPKGTTPRTLLHLLVSGKVKNYSVTFVEGWTFKQMLVAINKHPQIKHTLTGLNKKQIMEKIGKPGIDPEGRFFPDTYQFPKDFTDAEILKRAYRLMEEKLNEEWAKREKNLPIKTPYEALILASVVERETGTASERRTIAGVFIRRLRIGMRLQSDPTVIYGMGDAYKGNIRRKDLRKDTAHNTYTRAGLPITPIAMPSGKAIEAVLHPEPGKSLYFVARGDGSGTHKFSDNLRQHNNAVIKHQLKGRKRPFSSYPGKTKKK